MLVSLSVCFCCGFSFDALTTKIAQIIPTLSHLKATIELGTGEESRANGAQCLLGLSCRLAVFHNGVWWNFLVVILRGHYCQILSFEVK